MEQVKRHQPEEPPPALATDGKGAYREAMLETWGRIPEYGGKGRPPTALKPGKDWQYLQVMKKREGRTLVSVTTKVIYGDRGRGQKDVRRTYSICRKNPFALTPDEWEVGTQDAFLLKRASFPQSG